MNGGLLDLKERIAKMSALMDLKERIAREAEREFTRAFAAASLELPRILKGGVIDMGSKGQIPFARYEDLDRVLRPIEIQHVPVISEVTMPNFYWDVEQRSEQWDQLRLGIPTASCFGKIVTPKTLKLSSQREDYMDELLAEWMFGAPLEDPQSQYQSQWMERGTMMENDARSAYTFIRECDVTLCGFIAREDGMVGASPDGLMVADRHVLEIKCPSPKVHAHYMRTKRIEDEYLPQLQGLLYVSEYDRVDIISHCPPFPAVIVECGRDEKYISLLKSALDAFVETLITARELMQREWGQVIRQARPRA